jgi:hypothetical protein
MSVFERIRSMRTNAPAGASSDTDSGGGDDALLGYAKLNERHAIAALGPLNQVELTAIECFERTHRGRVPVLDKLRYLRDPEPLPGYDALEPDAIGERLAGVDATRVKAVREYERKHQNRPPVNAKVASALHELREPAETGAGDSPTAGSAQLPVRGNGLPIKVEPEAGLGTP